MKTVKYLVLLFGFLVGSSSVVTSQQDDTPKDDRSAEAAQVASPNASEQAPARGDDKSAAQGVAVPQEQPSSKGQTAPPTGGEPTQTDSSAAESNVKGLHLNFRGVSLEMVLNYLSDAAGFIINIKPGTDVKGKVDVWSNQPLTRDEAVDLLNTVLNQNGYAAIRKERTLTIMSREEAKKSVIPVIPTIPTNGPPGMPNTDEMVTQIIPIRYANATQMTKDLQPLLPSYASMTANESANALVLTDIQSDVRRMVEIVRALDTSISSISAVHVFPLKFADAKDLATAVKDLFQSPSQQNNNNPAARFFARFRGGFPGGPGGGDQTEGTGNSEARTAASRVVAVSDERSNSLVVSAPDELMPTIEQLVKELDVSVSDITELRVFHLKNADPVEMADMFSQLFPDESQTANANQNQGGFRFRGFGGRFGNNNNQSSESERSKKQSRVTAVADQRTSSVIVSAASELMPQIADMIYQLDSDKGRNQKVYVFFPKHGDPQQMGQVIQDMFQRSSTSMNRNNANENSALSTRAQSNSQNQTTTSGSTFGNTGVGNRSQSQSFR